MDRHLATGDPNLSRVNDDTIVEYLARFDRENITMRVRSRIIEELPGGTPNQSVVADALHLSRRSLQRRLQNERTTYKSLLEGTRRELALQYIREPHRSLAEITYLLGFSEPSNFTRAFRRWTGSSPAEYRRTSV